ncbi:MAG TPA: DUF3617 family protein [Deltaproteobacteria bacterium]|mgnify:CR=1 FL=1|nr:DUF3617 family protein [Deltaproteobacteria bacterium]HQB38033.1 DUF3617 family protein [Deltaproteobacteria bacterium]
MKKMVICTAVLGVLAFGAVAAQAVEEMREGKWEISSTVDMPGMPFKMPPTVMTHCYTKEDVKDRKKVVANQNNDCKVTEMKTSGNKVTWKMKCTGQSKGTMSGVTIFGKDYYNSTMKMQTEGHNMTTKVKARRIGNCD